MQYLQSSQPAEKVNMPKNNHPIVLGPTGKRLPLFSTSHLKFRRHATGYSRVNWAGHFLAGADGRVWLHRLICLDNIGIGRGGWHRCHHCNKPVSWFLRAPKHRSALVVDHLDGNRRNVAHQNLVPSCASCNSKQAHLRRRKASKCHAKIHRRVASTIGST